MTALDPALFDKQFAYFQKTIQQASGQPFRSFNEGLPARWEAYKPRVRDRALAILGVDDWTKEMIGEGQILERVIEAIEIKGSEQEGNNLVRWENRFGHASRSHRAMLDAVDDPAARRAFEQHLFDLYQGRAEPGAIFDELVRLVGRRYDLLAYLFFLNDIDCFMPNAPKTFDEAFELLGVELVTTERCSWDNYSQFNDALRAVQQALRERGGVDGAQLIDAHTFCWMLIRVDPEEERSRGGAGEGSKRSGIVTSYDARQKSVWTMANNAENAKQLGGEQTVNRTVKPKEVRMSRLALEKEIETLLQRQENRCALTGIPLQFHGNGKDPWLLPSLDRIDSNGHYEKGNLQVVCRFINFWKGDTDNDEFLRLLDLVRGEG